MPYQQEFANKSAHFDIVKNPEVAKFLDGCSYLQPPSDEESQKLAAKFVVPPNFDAKLLPERVIAVDGSLHESSINDKLPSTKIGYVKIGSVLIDLAQYGALRVDGGRYVDPFRVAEMENSNSPLTFSLPSANIRTHGKKSVRESFRAIVDEHLYSGRTRFVESDPKTSLRSTLFHLAAERPGPLGTGDPGKLRLHKCPECEKGPIEVLDVPDQQKCPHCSSEVYPSDCLRVWEEVSDFQSNYQAISRFMLQVEHMLPMHYARFLIAQSPASLSSSVFFLDGPLAVFGNGAWLHAAILRYLDRLKIELAKGNYSPVLIIGLQKTGQVADHVAFIDRFLPSNRIYAIEDEYRYKYILAGRDPSSNGFGSETYYGQDFIYKTLSGRVFVLAIPYPFPNKQISGINFADAKAEIDRYSDLPKALSLINHFETDLYENAVVPIALAHRYTAISLSPGGRVLDLLTRKAMEQKGLD